MANIDVGSLKLHFNNEVLKIKKYILQAKTQLIHKLTRNIQKLKKMKGTEEELKKFQTKADSTVTEVMFIKKIDHHELSRFAIKNFDNLVKFMDTPIVTKEKAMAKLLSHKCLKSRFQSLVKQFSIIPADTLLHVNPKKLHKKQKKMKEKSKAKSNDEPPPTNVSSNLVKVFSEDEEMEDNGSNSVSHSSEEAEDSETNFEKPNITVSVTSSKTKSNRKRPQVRCDDSDNLQSYNTEIESDSFFVTESKDNFFTQEPYVKPSRKERSETSRAKGEPTQDKGKSVKSETTVDSFFVTESGDNYLTLSLPRKPDLVSRDEESGMNRKMRRAALYGNDVKTKKSKPNKNVAFAKPDRFQKSSQSERRVDESKSLKSTNEEKLHPSWEAKKKKSALVAFQGKKVLFDD